MIWLLPFLILASCQTHKSVFWWGNCELVKHPAERVIEIQPNGYFRGDRPNELIGCFNVPAKIKESEMRVAQSVHLGELSMGDIIQYAVTLEVTNESYKDNWMFSHYLVLSDSFEGIRGQSIRRAYGYNCTPSMHHCDSSDAGIYQMKVDMEDAYLNLVVYGAGSTMEGSAFEVNQGYGDFEGFVDRAGYL